MNNGGPTAQIIDRNDWKTDKDFVGHRKAVVCVVSMSFSFNINFQLNFHLISKLKALLLSQVIDE